MRAGIAAELASARIPKRLRMLLEDLEHATSQRECFTRAFQFALVRSTVSRGKENEAGKERQALAERTEKMMCEKEGKEDTE